MKITPVQEVDEFTALVDMVAGDILVFDFAAMTATHAKTWDFMGVALHNCRVGEKVKACKRGHIEIIVKIADVPAGEVLNIDPDELKAKLQRDYDYYEHDVFDE